MSFYYYSLVSRRTLGTTVMNLWVPWKVRNFLIRVVIISFSRKPLLHGVGAIVFITCFQRHQQNPMWPKEITVIHITTRIYEIWTLLFYNINGFHLVKRSISNEHMNLHFIEKRLICFLVKVNGTLIKTWKDWYQACELIYTTHVSHEFLRTNRVKKFLYLDLKVHFSVSNSENLW
jgi:hypothetical protein